MALAPLFVALAGWQPATGVCRGQTARRGFVLGLLTGSVYFAGTLYWIGNTVATFGGLPWALAVPVTAIVVFYQALYVAVAAAMAGVIVRRFGAPGLLLAPAAWVSMEYARAHWFAGFPWIPLGNAVVTLLPLAQVASLVGVFGLSWLMATLSACFALAAVTAGRTRAAAIAAALLLVLAASLWGAARLRDNHLTRDGAPITVGLIQGNVPQGQKWDPARAGDIFGRYLAMSRQTAAAGATLLVWPESATPFYFDEDPRAAEQVRRLVRETGSQLLFGTDEIERASPDRYYNSAFVLDRGGATAAVYRKIHLVPFGEFVPLERWLSFVGPLVESVSSFSAGERITMLPINEHMATTAICYEVVYPHLIRDGVRQGSELLTTITNDAWYGESSAAYQHFELASMRAIEQGRYLARAANTGISGIVDPYGRVLARTRLFETTSVVGQVRFLQERTLYATIGDLAAQVAATLTVLAVAAAVFRRSPRRR